MKLTQRTVLVTGATSGIGRAFAEALHDRGNRVLATGRRQPLLDEMRERRPGLLGLALDLDETDAPTRLAAWLREHAPALDVVFANAGISRVEDMTSDAWTVADAAALVQTNILGVLRVAEATLPLLRRNGPATFAATSSALAFVPRADFPAYCASKAFLHSWLQSLRHQMRGHAIDVLEISPPYVQTALTGASQATDPRALPLADYVGEALRKLEAADTPDGELLLDSDLPRRWAERNGNYARVHAMLNPA